MLLAGFDWSRSSIMILRLLGDEKAGRCSFSQADQRSFTNIMMIFDLQAQSFQVDGGETVVYHLAYLAQNCSDRT